MNRFIWLEIISNNLIIFSFASFFNAGHQTITMETHKILLIVYLMEYFEDVSDFISNWNRTHFFKVHSNIILGFLDFNVVDFYYLISVINCDILFTWYFKLSVIELKRNSMVLNKSV